MNLETITRQRLYELVWAEPISSLIKRYETSYPDMRKICLKMIIPIPGSGYWHKKRFGKRLTQTPLPTNYSGEQEVVLKLKLTETEVQQATLLPIEMLQKELETDSRLHLDVPKQLVLPDRLIQKARDGFVSRIKSEYYRGGIISPDGDEVIEILVTKERVDRALLIMDIVIKALRARGHDIELDHRGTHAVVFGEKITFSLIERSARTIIDDGKWKRQELIPTGKLAFRMKRHFHTKEFVDGKKPVEQQISRILAELELHGTELKEEHRLNEIRWAQEAEEQRIHKQEQERREKELKKFKGLMKLALRSRQTEDLRYYLDKVEAKALSTNSITPEMTAWLSWSRAKADWFDPIIESEDELLSEVDRDTVMEKHKAAWEP